MKNTVNQRVKELREFLNLSQADFAKKVDSSVIGISKIENNHNNPSTRTLQKIISNTSVSEAWLLRGEGEITVDKQETVSDNVSAKTGTWTEKAFDAIKSKNEHLEQEVKYLRDMLKHMITGKAEANFNPAILPAGIFGNESVWNSVSAQRA